MKNHIQKTGAISFLILGGFPLILTFFFTLRELSIRSEMRTRLETRELQTLRISEKDVVWIEDHEIRVKGRMFDIKSRQLQDGMYTFTGLWDDDETSLLLGRQRSMKEMKDSEQLIIQLLICCRGIFTETVIHSPTLPAYQLPLHGFIILGKPQFVPPVNAPPPRKGFLS